MMTFKYHPRQQNSRRYIYQYAHRKSKFDQLYTSKIKIRSALCIENQNSISSMHRKSKFDQLYISPGVLLARVIFIKMPSSVIIRCAPIFYAHVLRFQKLVSAHKVGRQQSTSTRSTGGCTQVLETGGNRCQRTVFVSKRSSYCGEMRARVEPRCRAGSRAADPMLVQILPSRFAV